LCIPFLKERIIRSIPSSNFLQWHFVDEGSRSAVHGLVHRDCEVCEADLATLAAKGNMCWELFPRER
jgi:hypothetical protein